MHLRGFADEVVGREFVAVHDLDDELRRVVVVADGDGEDEGLVPLGLASRSW